MEPRCGLPYGTPVWAALWNPGVGLPMEPIQIFSLAPWRFRELQGSESLESLEGFVLTEAAHTGVP